MTRHSSKSKPAIPSQEVAAKRLGVTREHLNRVLNGHRQSRRLRARYNRLIKGEEAVHVA